jgi:hypothetical protein
VQKALAKALCKRLWPPKEIKRNQKKSEKNPKEIRKKSKEIERNRKKSEKNTQE